MIFSTWIRNWKRSLDRRWALHQTLRRKSGARRFASRPRLEVLEDRRLLTAIDVTSTADINAPGTLIYAINHVNLGNYNEIDFQIGNVGSAQTINLTSQLPALTASGVTINGLSQGGPFNTKPLITLNGSGAGSSDGLLLQGSNCIVSGLIVSNFGSNGIEVDGSNNIIGGTATGAGNVISGNSGDGIRIDSSVSGTQVQGNYIGTNVAGTAALANGNGIEVIGANNTVGGTVAGAGNLISGNNNAGVLLDRYASGNQVLGNSIGTNLAGSGAVANGNGVEILGSGNGIGGITATAGNTISGNNNDGVLIDAPSSGNLVLGNYIGINTDGTAALANSGNGIDVFGIKNTVGGDVSEAGNVISGNSKDGVLVNSIASGTQVMGNYIGTNFDGTVALANSTGIEIAGINNTVGGLGLAAQNLISGNSNYGVQIDFSANGNQVFGNYIGTNAIGIRALPNSTGIAVFGSNNTIGGSSPAFMNLISGNRNYGVLIDSNVSGILVLGNEIGIDQSAYGALPNSIGIIVAGNNNTIGGADPNGHSNQISGNSSDGVLITGTGNQVLSNYIGTNIFGDRALPNSNGIEVAGSDNTIGGSASGAGNLISGNGRAGTVPPNFYNTGDGVLIDSSASGTQVLGNTIGVNAAGTSSLNNSGTGIEIAGYKNIVGGTAPGDRNIISGNGTNTQDTQSGSDVLIDSGASGNVVLGNYVGTNTAGTAGVSSVTGIEVDGSNNTVGGAASGAGNLISGIYDPGGGLVGLNITGSANQVLGNSIGVAAGGDTALPNNYGIGIDGNNNTIGGAASGDRNIISGNPLGGVDIWGSNNQVLGNYIGTNAAGNAAVANGIGISVRFKGSGNTLGGTASGAGNLISGNSTEGVLIDSTAGGNNLVLGNSIGTTADGTGALGNHVGIEIGSSNNTVGGTVSGAGNLISGNSDKGVWIYRGVSGILVEGNSIGTDVAGIIAVANGTGIYDYSTGNTIGGTAAGAGNLISGNRGTGLVVAGSDLVLGNSIGTNAAGNAALPNSDGIVLGSNNTVGGTALGDLNLISGNSNDGILINGSGNQVLGNSIGTDITGATATGTDGKSLGNGGNGIEVNSTNNNMIGGTAAGAGNLISGNSKAGVQIDWTGSGTGSGNQVLGNSIGTDITGNAALANGDGIDVGGAYNTIGGTVSGAGNLISGNTRFGVSVGFDNLVLGNTIGTNYAGTAALPNSIGVYLSVNDTVGGTTSAARNLISGNSGEGVFMDNSTSGNLVLGNYIGTNAAGTAAVANGIGIKVEGINNTLGGTASGEGNLISGNSNDGVRIDAFATGNQVLGNYIGTNAGGSAALANSIGIEVDANSNTVGGAASGAGNLISGDSYAGVLISGSANQVLGNLIGVALGGNAALADGTGIYVNNGSSNTIGGTNSGDRNLISGNSTDGMLFVGGSANQVMGNYIGTNADGSAALANHHNGIYLQSGSDNTIGGGGAGAGNLISGNSGIGLWITGSGTQVLGNTVGADAAGNLSVANGTGIEVDSGGNTIGGTDSGAHNVISGNSGGGLVVGSDDLVLGNYIGVNAADNTYLHNSVGIVLGSNNTVGGTASGDANIISGNSNDGVLILGNGNQVLGNYIGINYNHLNIANGHNGIYVQSGSDNTIGGTASGAGNIISGNREAGVLIAGSSTQVLGNTIGVIYYTDNLGSIYPVFNVTGIEITGNNNSIGGTVPGAGNILAGNAKEEMLITGSSNQVLGNSLAITGIPVNTAIQIGTGIEIAGNNNTIGGTASGAGNFISGHNSSYNPFPGQGTDGVKIDATASGNLLLGNYIGTDSTGSNALANHIGVEIDGSSNTVGGTASGAGNLISGNTYAGLLISGNANQVLGNLIGVALGGNAALADGTGIYVNNGSSNTIGGTASGAGNLISGNSTNGIMISSAFISGTGFGGSDNQVLGNSIGTNADGTAALPNHHNGIYVQSGFDNTIGGADSGAGNLISGNSQDGVRIDSGATGNQVMGNSIGTTFNGTGLLANSGNGIEIAGVLNTVCEGNLISGNNQDGVLIDSGGSGNQVMGNTIGVSAAGTGLANSGNGIEIAGDNNIVGGSAGGTFNLISGNSKDGVLIDSGATGNQVLGSAIGTDRIANSAVPNSIGVEIAGSNNTIGGTAAGAGDIISGDSYAGLLISGSGNQVLGNSIGVAYGGDSALADGTGIYIQNASGNTIGGTASGARNIISGNSTDGMLISGDDNQMLGNYIGTNADGSAALANLHNGIYIQSGSDNAIGGAASGAGNLISGNSRDGVWIDSGATGTQVLGNSIGVNADGSTALANTIGIEIDGASNTVGGSVSGAGNLISGDSYAGVLITSSANQVLGNSIGVAAGGNSAVADGTGIYIQNGSGNIIGGTASGARNIISGNSTDGMLISGDNNQMLGNYIGTTADGSGSLANHHNGIFVQSGSGNTIGGTVSGAGNLISGNSSDGVLIASNSNQVSGNLIGTNAHANAALPNSNGVVLGGNNNTIGGFVPQAQNLIDGNSGDGVSIYGSGNQVLGNEIGAFDGGNLALPNAIGVEVEGSNNTVGGATFIGVSNFIAGNNGDGVKIDSGASGNQLSGNYIGTNLDGNAATPNSGNGIEVAGTGNTIGGAGSGAGNLISGNSKDGVLLNGSGNQVLGNSIGTDLTGATATGTDGKPLGNSNGIEATSSNNTIGGTASGAHNLISGNGNDGVLIGIGASGNQVLGNSVGVNAAGNAAVANSNGIEVDSFGNMIGGTAAGARNLISGNSNDGVRIDHSAGDDNQVLGNYIGTDVTGDGPLPNSIGIFVDGSGNTIGGTAAGAANLISGNSDDGLYIGNGDSDNQVLGNSVGVNAAGTAALANSNGIEVNGISNTIGGTVSAARNIISGNHHDGVKFDDAGSGNVVSGNYIGTDVTGATATGTDGKPLGNSIGVEEVGSGNMIGSTVYGADNVISGNLYGVKIESDGNQVFGNFIGTNASGTAALGNSVGVYLVGGNNTIGGTIDAGDTNLISGNSSDGVLIAGSDNQVTGNNIGTNAGGSAAVANSVGIEVSGIKNTIGGTAFGRAYNLISGNSKDGVLIDSSGSGNQVLNNYIGTDFSFSTSVANSIGVEVAGSNNTIGGTASGAGTGNFISGNGADGVRIDSSGSGNQVLGNSIGINAYYNALANSGNGVEVLGSSNTVGGTASGAVNIISGNGKDGVLIGSSGSGNQVLGNFIGTVGSDNKPLANSGNGVEVDGIDNTVGGTTSNASNFISYNSKDGVLIGSSGSGNQVLGNYIGTDFSGTIAVPNSLGVEIAGSNNTVGGTASGARNLISGNSTDGVLIDSGGSGNQVLGNYIGTDTTGNNALANNAGISVLGNDNTIGGAVSGAGNLISGNNLQGVLIGNTASGNVASGNQVLGNYIGTNAAGTAILTESASNNRIGVMVDGNNNTVGGAAPGARNVIAGNFYGVLTDGASNQVLGNYIGTNAAGTKALANDYGLEIVGNSNTVGGTTPGAGNLISGNDTSLDIQGGYTQVLGNDIGTAADGNTPLPNQSGIYLWTKNNTIGGTVAGASNLITGNSDFGVNSFAGSGNSIRQNSIYANGPTSTGPGIAVDSGSAPSLSSATLSGTTLTVKGTFSGTATVTYVLDFYANPTGDPEGKVFLGSLTVTPTNTGSQAFTFTTTTSATETNPLITATLTDASGTTSAFSSGVMTSSGSLGSPPPSSPPPSSPPPSSTPPSSSTPALSPLQMTLEVALDTAAYLLQGNVPVLLELEGLSEMFLGQSLPPSSDLLATILSDWSVSGSAGLLGFQLGLSFADSVNGKTT